MDTRKVLIAEDDASVRKAVQRVLELEKYEVTAVNDGQAALEALSQKRYDLAVLDDYLVKPFVVDELLARCRALLRRTTPTAANTTLRVGDLVLNSLTREARRGDRDLQLTKTEFDLLELLMQHPGIVVSRDHIYEVIWGYDFETGSKSLDVYIGYLRRKTEDDGESRLVYTVRGVGYTVKES